MKQALVSLLDWLRPIICNFKTPDCCILSKRTTIIHVIL